MHSKDIVLCTKDSYSSPHLKSSEPEIYQVYRQKWRSM